MGCYDHKATNVQAWRESDRGHIETPKKQSWHQSQPWINWFGVRP